MNRLQSVRKRVETGRTTQDDAEFLMAMVDTLRSQILETRQSLVGLEDAIFKPIGYDKTEE